MRNERAENEWVDCLDRARSRAVLPPSLRSSEHAAWGWRRIALLCALCSAFILGGTLVAPRAAAQEPHLALLAEKLRTELDRIALETDAVVGATVIDLTTGERFGVNDTLTFPQGSAIKIPILIELYRQAEDGRLQLDEQLPVTAAQQVGGSGVIQHFADAESAVSLHDLAVLMIVLSDNTATNLLIERVGMAEVNRTMEELGLSGIRLQREMIRPDQSAAGNENLATPAEAAELMRRIASCELPMSEDRCQQLRGILEIPKGGSFPDPIPNEVSVAWKPGGIEGVGTAWGLVALPGRPYAVSVMANYAADGAQHDAIRQVSAASYAYFYRLARSTPYGARVPLELLQDRVSTRDPQHGNNDEPQSFRR